jgi:8-oxo-dGTP diphosphatase
MRTSLIVSQTITEELVIVKWTRYNRIVAFAVAVDLVVFTIREDELCVLAVRRGASPYRGRWALPGGFVHEDEGLLAAARRELAEETGLDELSVHLEQLGTYGAPRRDPRLRVVSVAYLALAAELPDPAAGTDASDALWRPAVDLLSSPSRLAFDHDEILADGLERARAKLEYSPLATAFCSDEFTVAELRRVYEVAWGTELDPRNFHRKVTGSPGFLTPTGRMTTRNGGRPAQLYRRGVATLLNPPISRETSPRHAARR